MTGLRFREAGDAALLVELGEGIDPAVNARAVSLAARLRADPPGGVRDVTATYRSVAVVFDPRRTDLDALKARILRQEHRLYPTALRWAAEGRLRLVGHRVEVDLPPGATRSWFDPTP